jgi:hypothetical protein
MNSRRFNASISRASRKDSTALLRCGISIWPMSLVGHYKSLFALVIKNSPGCRRDFRVKMWGTSSPDDEFTGDFGNATEATRIAGRWLVRLVAGNLSPGNFGLLQHNLP